GPCSSWSWPPALNSRTDGIAAVPAVDSESSPLIEQPPLGREPGVGPGLGVVQLGLRVGPAPRDESRIDVSAGWPADGLVSEIEAPPQWGASVGKRAVAGAAMHQDRVAGTERYRQVVLGHQSVGDGQPRTGRAVRQQALKMAPRPHVQTAVLDRGLRQSE